ncbi:MAG TPA: tRNA preQ1(34) S-adenosylmethionine ribosyltransferase-isomerase QueA, partial [Marinobacter hydrocarbonoclasticus]|nr:tRNA preQ1(34) S-adenosylmethionine ribosyltransferase-isomerase QueA [Marinobacter nauticus]
YRFFSYGDAMFLTAQEPSRGMMLGTDSAEPHQTESRGESQ